MNRKRVGKATGDIVGSLSSFLPVVLLGVGGFMLFKWLKASGGLSGLIANLLGTGKPGSDVSNEKSEASFDHIKQVLAGKNLHPNALHTSLANSIFDLMNEVSPTLLGSIISASAQIQIYNLYNGVNYTADDAMIYEEYGSRRANNRQSTWLGFLWDDTTGDLRQHVNRFMDGENKTKMLALIDKAINTYLV